MLNRSSYFKGVLLLAMLVIMQCFAQAQKFSKSELKELEEADQLMEFADYWNALKIYRSIYFEHKNDAALNYKMGFCSFHLRKYQQDALDYFEKASNQNHVPAYLYLGQSYHLEMRFDEALQYYKKYMAESTLEDSASRAVSRFIEVSHRAKQMVNDKKAFTVKNMGLAVNSRYPDYAPVITADESMLVFTSRRAESTGRLRDPYNEFYEDVYFSMNDGEKWQDAESIGKNINTATHDACVGGTPDGKRLIIYRTNKEMTGGDLYWTFANSEGWQKPKKFDERINSDWQEASATYSSDGNIMIFSSSRPGGFGGKDLYRSIRFGNGDWSLPVNLGPQVNSSFDEDGPFLHPDNRSLFFSSRGHTTMGGYDVFSVTRTDSGSWSIPQNVGYPLNTVSDDIYFVLSGDGKRGYYSSNTEGGFGEQDIYEVYMPENRLNLNVVKGFVLEKGSDQPVQAELTLINQDDRSMEGFYLSNATSGKYLLILVPGRDYKIIVEAEGYGTQTISMNYADKKGLNEIFRDLKLPKLTEE